MTAGTLTVTFTVENATELDADALNDRKTRLTDALIYTMLENGLAPTSPPIVEFVASWGRNIAVRVIMNCEAPDGWTQENTEQFNAQLNTAQEDP